MQKKAVLLDLGGVVFQSTGISNRKIQWEVISQLNYKYGHALNLGGDLFEIFMQEYNALTGQHLPGADFLRLVFDTLSFNQSLVDGIQKVFPITIVSDNYRENIAYISRRFHFSEWSTDQYYSFDFGLEKAQPEFFKRLLEEIPYTNRELLLIDDSPRKLASAATKGIDGIHFQHTEQTLRELVQYV